MKNVSTSNDKNEISYDDQSAIKNVTAVITCMTRDEHKYIVETISSVLVQTHPCCVNLYVSEDDCEIENVLGKLTEYVKIHRIPLQRPGTVRNIGVSAASTEWIAFLDGDDLWVPQKIEKQMQFAAKTGCKAIGARHKLIREDGKAFFFGFAKTHPMPSSWLVERNLLVKEPFSDWPQAEDVELWRRLQKRVNASTLQDYLISYRVRRTSLSSGTFWKKRKYFFAYTSGFPVMRYGFLCLSRILSYF